MVSIKKKLFIPVLLAFSWLVSNTNQHEVYVGKSFDLQVPSANQNEIFLVSRLDPLFLSNSFKDESYFRFIALQAGETQFSLDRILKNQSGIEKDFYVHKIIIKNIPRPKAISKPKKPLEQPKPKITAETIQYRQIVDLYELGAKNEAVSRLGEWLENYPSATNLFESRILLAEWQLNQGLTNDALSLLTENLKRFPIEQSTEASLKPQINSRLLLAKLKLAMNMTDESLSILQPAAALENVPLNLRDKVLRMIGKVLESEDRYAPALDKYLSILKMYEAENRFHLAEDPDELYFLIAQAYEADSEKKDIGQAMQYYKLIINEYPLSSFRQAAKKRVDYIQYTYFP